MSYVEDYVEEAAEILRRIDQSLIHKILELLVDLRQKGGRLFFLGVGGGAGHASHAVNDFRKIAGIEAYTPTDNVSELTARINDDSWETSFVNWLRVSRLIFLRRRIRADSPTFRCYGPGIQSVHEFNGLRRNDLIPEPL